MCGNTDKINASLSAYHLHKGAWEGGRTHQSLQGNHFDLFFPQ